MQLKRSPRHILNVMTQGRFHHWEGDFLPGDGVAGKEPHVQTFKPCTELLGLKTADEGHVDLSNTRQAQYGMEPRNGHLRLRLLERLPHRRLFGTFAEFHEASRIGPET